MAGADGYGPGVVSAAYVYGVFQGPGLRSYLSVNDGGPGSGSAQANEGGGSAAEGGGE